MRKLSPARSFGALTIGRSKTAPAGAQSALASQVRFESLS